MKVTLASLAVIAGSAIAAPPMYRFEILSDPGSAVAINDAGQILGFGNVDLGNPGYEGFVWTEADGVTILPNQRRYDLIRPRAMNENGQVVGIHQVSDPEYDEFCMLFSDDYTGSVVPVNGSFGRATAIDARGHAYGEVGVPDITGYYFGTYENPQMTVLAPGHDVRVWGAGYDYALGEVDRLPAILYADQTFELLPDAPNISDSLFPGDDRAMFVSTDGSLIVGDVTQTASNFQSQIRQPAVWTNRANPTLLPSLPQQSINWPFGMNDHGVVVGLASGHPIKGQRAAAWFDGVAYDLNDLNVEGVPPGYLLVSARDINNHGVIVGNFTVNGNTNYTGMFVLTPITPPCEADLNGDGVLDFFDVTAFLDSYGNADPSADFNDDGVIDFFDVSTFLALFGGGCP